MITVFLVIKIPAWGPHSSPCFWHQIIEDEKDNNQSARNITKQFAIIPSRACHGGETLHTPSQQACHTHEIWVLRETERWNGEIITQMGLSRDSATFLSRTISVSSYPRNWLTPKSRIKRKSKIQAAISLWETSVCYSHTQAPGSEYYLQSIQCNQIFKGQVKFYWMQCTLPNYNDNLCECNFRYLNCTQSRKWRIKGPQSNLSFVLFYVCMMTGSPVMSYNTLHTV